MSETQVNNAVLDSITEWVSNTQNATKNANTINYTVPVDQTSKLYILPSTVLSNIPTLNMAFKASTTAAGSVGYWQPSSGTLLAVSCKGTRFSVQMGQVETGYVITNSTAAQAVQLRINVPVETGAGVGTGSATGSGVLIELLLTNDKCIALPLIGSTYNCFFNAEDTFPVYIRSAKTIVNNVTFHTNVLTCNNAGDAFIQKQLSVKKRILPIAVGIALAALASSSIMRPSQASPSQASPSIDSLLEGQCPLSINHNGILYSISTAYNATAKHEYGDNVSRISNYGAKLDSVEPHLLNYEFINEEDEEEVTDKLQKLKGSNKECYQPTFQNSIQKLEYELLKLHDDWDSDRVYVLVDDNDQIQICALLKQLPGKKFEYRAYSDNVKRFLQLKLDALKTESRNEIFSRTENFNPYFEKLFVDTYGFPLNTLYRLPWLNSLTKSVQKPNSLEVVEIANGGPPLTEVEIANEGPQLTEETKVGN